MFLNRNNFNKWKNSKWTSWFGGVCTGLLISALSPWITPYLTPKDPCANLATKGYERTREHFGEALKMHDIEGVEDFLN